MERIGAQGIRKFGNWEHLSPSGFLRFRLTIYRVSHATYLLSFLVVACWEPSVYSQSPSALEAVYQRANANYEAGRYQQAAEKYEQVVASIPNGSVYYNLGNAYFRLGKRGKAILNYERAKRLIPRDRDLNFNLKVARAQNIDRFDLVKPPSGFSLLYRSLHPDEIAWLGLVPYWVAAAGVIIMTFTQNRRLKRGLRYLVLFGYVVWIFSFLLLRMKIQSLNAPYAIVTTAEVAVRNAPDSGAEAVEVPLHEGTKVHIQEERRDWIEIDLPDDNSGWLPADAVERI